MTFTGVDAFDNTLHKTSVWLTDVMKEMEWDDRRRAYVALRAVLHALRDRLMAEEAVDLGAQLPMLIRGFYYEGWRPAGKPLKYRHKKDFVSHVAGELLGLSDDELERAIRAVFKVLSSHIGEGEVDQVRKQLPAEVRELWT